MLRSSGVSVSGLQTTGSRITTGKGAHFIKDIDGKSSVHEALSYTNDRSKLPEYTWQIRFFF